MAVPEAEAVAGVPEDAGRTLRFHRLATVLAEVNDRVQRATRPEEVFEAAVSVAVEHGRFVMSWVGLVDPATGAVVPQAWAGDAAEAYLDAITVTADDRPTGQGPTGRAIRTGAPSFSNDIRVDWEMTPWKVPAQRVGFRSSGAFPLSVDGRVVGCLTAYASEPGYFGEAEVDLLQRLAATVSYGWAAIERHRQAAALQAEREAFQRIESLGQLAGGVAHDFNNLLGVILNYTTLLEHQITESGPRSDLGEIRAAAERATALTRQLLAFARPAPVDPVPVDLNRVVLDVTEMLGRALGSSVQLSVRLHPDPLVVTGDAHQMEQVLVNLIINGRDAMPEGGRIVVATGRTAAATDPVTAPEPGEWCLLSVTDTGYGMDREVRARALEPFFTTKPQGQGTGLGLATVYNISRRLGGDVTIDSEVGEGTCVTVRLPAADGTASPASATDPVPGRARGGHERVLVVEDDAHLCAATARLLEASGYRVTAARSGTEALARAAADERGFDLVLTDVRMPGISGIELARRLTARRPDTRVVMVSGDDPGGPRLPWRLLPKPVSEHDLLVALRAELDA